MEQQAIFTQAGLFNVLYTIQYIIYIQPQTKATTFIYSETCETLNNEYIERIHQMSYSSLSDNGMLQIFSFLIK